MEFGVPYVTTGGIALLNRATAMDKIVFTGFSAGDGVMNNPTYEKIIASEHLLNAVKDFPIGYVDYVDDAVRVTGEFRDIDASRSFDLRELGLFARLDSDAAADAILFAYAYTASPSHVDNARADIVNKHKYTVMLNVSQAEAAAITIYDDAVVPRHPHGNLTPDGKLPIVPLGDVFGNEYSLVPVAADSEGIVKTGTVTELLEAERHISIGRKANSRVGAFSLSVGADNVASGLMSFAFGEKNEATEESAHAEGYMTKATGAATHAEGGSTIASGMYSHAEGSGTTASGSEAHAEGDGSTASGEISHAEGYNTTASGVASHAEGMDTTASEEQAHAEGFKTTASGADSHAEGTRTTASGDSSHAEGERTIAAGDAQHVEGKCNIADQSGTYAHIVGNGTDDEHRSNAHTLDWNGNAWFAGGVELNDTVTGDRYRITIANGQIVATRITGV